MFPDVKRMCFGRQESPGNEVVNLSVAAWHARYRSGGVAFLSDALGLLQVKSSSRLPKGPRGNAEFPEG